MATQKSILIIEDEEMLQGALATALSDVPCTVLTANDGETGLASALENHPDLILLDMVLPVLDGNEVLSKLREDEWGKTANVIILSALKPEEGLTPETKATVQEYLVKTEWKLTDVFDHVKELLSEKK